MPSKSKAKGSAWERSIAQHLTELYGEPFLRTPSSGAFVGGINRHRVLTQQQHKNRKGDVTAPDAWLHFNIEAKSYADFPFHQLVRGDEVRILDSWIEQLLFAAQPNDYNFIAMKFNRKGNYILTPKLKNLNLSKGIEYKDQWHFLDYELFWKHNYEQVKHLSINGVAADFLYSSSKNNNKNQGILGTTAPVAD